VPERCPAGNQEEKAVQLQKELQSRIFWVISYPLRIMVEPMGVEPQPLECHLRIASKRWLVLVQYEEQQQARQSFVVD
jgi:hypothetical protein